MSRRIGNDEFAFGRGEITVGHVYGNALFALGGKAVCQLAKSGVSPFSAARLSLSIWSVSKVLLS